MSSPWNFSGIERRLPWLRERRLGRPGGTCDERGLPPPPSASSSRRRATCPTPPSSSAGRGHLRFGVALESSRSLRAPSRLAFWYSSCFLRNSTSSATAFRSASISALKSSGVRRSSETLVISKSFDLALFARVELDRRHHRQRFVVAGAGGAEELVEKLLLRWGARTAASSAKWSNHESDGDASARILGNSTSSPPLSAEATTSSSRSTSATETTLSSSPRSITRTPCVARPMVRMSRGWCAQDFALLGDDEQFLVFVDLGDADHLAVLVGHLEILQTQPAAALDAVFVEVRSLGVALLRDRQQGSSGFDHLHGDDLVALAQLDAAHAISRPAHAAHIALAEANRHSLLAADEDLAFAIGQLHRHHLVVGLRRPWR